MGQVKQVMEMAVGQKMENKGASEIHDDASQKSHKSD